MRNQLLRIVSLQTLPQNNIWNGNRFLVAASFLQLFVESLKFIEIL